MYGNLLVTSNKYPVDKLKDKKIMTNINVFCFVTSTYQFHMYLGVSL